MSQCGSRQHIFTQLTWAGKLRILRDDVGAATTEFTATVTATYQYSYTRQIDSNITKHFCYSKAVTTRVCCSVVLNYVVYKIIMIQAVRYRINELWNFSVLISNVDKMMTWHRAASFITTCKLSNKMRWKPSSDILLNLKMKLELKNRFQCSRSWTDIRIIFRTWNEFKLKLFSRTEIEAEVKIFVNYNFFLLQCKKAPWKVLSLIAKLLIRYTHALDYSRL